MRTLLLIAVLLIAGSSPSFSQCDNEPGPGGLTWEYETEKKGFSIFGFLGDAFTPRIVLDVKAIRGYVRDERFVELTKLCGDQRAVDAIYLRALKIAEYHIGRALFLSMAATMEHQNLDVRMPLVESIKLPLTFEEDSLFKSRTKNLPARIYPDSPMDEHGDKDKLQHFFGSAYLAYATESREVARSTGDVMEWGEARFVVGGADDSRDRIANIQGEKFGHDLLLVKTLLPSDYLNLPVKVE
ncbi:MAG: hypothetical protein L0Y80_02690 [Ignavibacteriae bacterium]|nr:hypothetical protein [Ignavibacteriota bacterium]